MLPMLGLREEQTKYLLRGRNDLMPSRTNTHLGLGRRTSVACGGVVCTAMLFMGVTAHAAVRCNLSIEDSRSIQRFRIWHDKLADWSIQRRAQDRNAGRTAHWKIYRGGSTEAPAGTSGLVYQPLNDRAFIVMTAQELSRQSARLDAGSTTTSNCEWRCSQSGSETIETCQKKYEEMEMLNTNCTTRWSYLLAGALGTGMTLTTSTVHAQETSTASQTVALEEIVITAERRTENLQKTAVSVSVRSGRSCRSKEIHLGSDSGGYSRRVWRRVCRCIERH
jgi:hypothetical protein